MVSFHKNCYKSISFNDIYLTLVGFLWSRDLCLDKFYFNVLFQWRCLNSPLVLNLSDIYFRSSSNLISPVWLWLFSAAFPCFLMRNLFLLVYQWVSHISLRKFYSPKNQKFRFWSFQSSSNYTDVGDGYWSFIGDKFQMIDLRCWWPILKITIGHQHPTKTSPT